MAADRVVLALATQRHGYRCLSHIYIPALYFAFEGLQTRTLAVIGRMLLNRSCPERNYARN